MEVCLEAVRVVVAWVLGMAVAEGDAVAGIAVREVVRNDGEALAGETSTNDSGGNGDCPPGPRPRPVAAVMKPGAPRNGTMATLPVNRSMSSPTDTLLYDLPPITGSFIAVHLCLRDGSASAANETSGMTDRPDVSEVLAPCRIL